MVDRDDDIDPDAPASAEEIAASRRLRDALDGARASASADASAQSPEIDLALSLKAAWDPGGLAVDESRAMVDATPAADEQELAAALREALASKRMPLSTDSGALQLAHALRSAFAPPELDAKEHRAILDAALTRMPAKHAAEERGANVMALHHRGARRKTVVRVAFGFAAGGLALAASVLLVVTSAPGPGRGAEAPLAKARTTQPLFSEPFRPGETSARIDRIASARAADFRDNRFTKWGVR